MRLSLVAPFLWILPLVAACTGEPEDTDPPTPPPCGPSLPLISNAAIEDNGPMAFGDTTWPSLRLTFEASDPDGALTSYRILVGYDDDIDGMVEMTDPIVAENSFGEHDCSVGFAELFMDIAVNGEPPMATVVEFGVVLEDADGQQSDPPVILGPLTSPSL